jgi:hypothetical protein
MICPIHRKTKSRRRKIVEKAVCDGLCDLLTLLCNLEVLPVIGSVNYAPTLQQ